MTADTYRFVAGHESGHAAAGVMLGRLPRMIEVGQIGRTLGRVDFPFKLNKRSASDVMLITMAGWVADEEEPPSWPIPDMGTGGDHGTVAKLTEYMGLDESGYRRLVIETWELAATKEFDRLQLAFRTALEYRPVLDRDFILDLIFVAIDDVDRVAELLLDPHREEVAP